MPLYDYRCQDCDHSFEMVVTARTMDSVACPECAGMKLERLIGVPSIGRVSESLATNCRGDGPPCGLPRCGRKT